MIEINKSNVTQTQLLLLKNFEDGLKNVIKNGLAECDNKKLNVGIGMRLTDYSDSDCGYKLNSNASFSLKGSHLLVSKAKEFLNKTPLSTIVPNSLLVVDLDFKEEDKQDKKKDNEENATVFTPTIPKYRLEQVILSEETKNDILDSLKIIKCKDIIYKDWGFEEVDPVPRSVLNFYGEPGTGKTMTAHAVANYLGKNILLLNYSEIESKYVGEAPKNLQKAFDTAKQTNSVLFFDEADSFLGKRIQNVNHGSDQALNSLRSQMLILLEEFSGVVIFATNLVTNFDTAFESRILKHLYFGLPNKDARAAIMSKMIPSKLPKDSSFTLEKLTEESDFIEGFSGREIKNAILDMILNKAENIKEGICFNISDLHNALAKKKESKKRLKEETDRLLKEKITKKLKEKAEEAKAIAESEKENSGNKDAGSTASAS